MKKLTIFFTAFCFSIIGEAQDLPTIGEVFDFNLQDEFVRVSSSQWYTTVYHDRIIDVEYSSDNTEVNYTILRDTYTALIDSYYPESLNDTVEFDIINLDSSLYYYDDLFAVDTIHYVNDTLLCGVEVFGAHSSGIFGGNQREYVIGLGLILHENWSDTGYSSLSLIFYLKDGQECGTLPDFSLGVNSDQKSQNVSVFPTIFVDVVNIETDIQNQFTVQIYSLMGQEILKIQSNSPTIQLDLSFAEQGTYIYLIRGAMENDIIKAGRIIKGK